MRAAPLIGTHTHVYAGPSVREDVAPVPLVERFGLRWWFDVCEACGECRICPATADFRVLAPEVPGDWELWREDPAEFEITQTMRALG